MDKIIEKIRKHYRFENNIMELIFSNYEGLNYYVRLDLDKKDNICYLRSYNFDLFNTFNKKYINTEALNGGFADHIYDILLDVDVPLEYHTLKGDDGVVKLQFKEGKNIYKYSFNYFLPKDLAFLQEILFTVVSDLPGRLSELFFELSADINNNKDKYIYNKPFKFDLLKGDLTKVFNKDIITKGLEYYKEDRVRFVEEVNGAYYAMVNGNNNNLYSVIIKYDKKRKASLFNCNCPCTYKCMHMYAVIEHIRRKEFYSFYKVLDIEFAGDQMYDQLFASNNTYLCVGIEDKSVILLMPNGNLNSYYILDKHGNYRFKVIEDDDNHSLQKEFDKIKELD